MIGSHIQRHFGRHFLRSLFLQAKEQLVRSNGGFLQARIITVSDLFYIIGKENVELTSRTRSSVVDVVDKSQTPSPLISEPESRLEEE